MNEGIRFEEVLERFGQLVYPNKGVSMMPLLRQDRDLMVIDRKGALPCRKYDAVLFKRSITGKPDAYVLHRILRVNGDGTYWIVGDNCVSGETVREEQILGTMQAVIRDGKRVSVTDPRYRAYVHLWCDAWPLRFAVLRTKNFAGRVLRKLRLRK